MHNKARMVRVIASNGGELHPTTIKKAYKMVNRSKAKWIEEKRIVKILYGKEDFRTWRKEVIEKAKRICYICGEYIPEGEIASIDHFIPVKLSGKDSKENLQCCCTRCNAEKGNMLLSEYIERMKENPTKYHYINFEKLEKTNKRLMEATSYEDIKFRTTL